MKVLLLFGLVALASAIENPCICTREYLPVCGSDGVTYGNKCTFNCEKLTKNPGLVMVHKGPCNEVIEENEEHPCACPLIWDPLCGSDGLTYPNECSLQCHQHYTQIQVVHKGPCEEHPENVEEFEEQALDPCACDRVLNPVCGSDGQTYDNRCELRCARYQNNEPDLVQLHAGECTPDESRQINDPCVCDRMYYPVCGNDGNTYGNPCMLGCAAASHPGLVQLHDGECDHNNVAIEEDEEDVELFNNPCACNKMLRPVCGSDGHTYSNPCTLNCAKATVNPNLKLQHYGACNPKAFQVMEHHEHEQLTCACNRMLLPVCGSDGVTYANPCLLDCAKRSDSELRLERYGPCLGHVMLSGEEAKVDEPCVCNRMYFPLCGTDGQTYNNPCLLKCAVNRGKSSLKVAHEGRCYDVAKVENCYCGDYYSPVCGKEGGKLITYKSVCEFSCAAKENPNLSFEKHTACEVNAVQSFMPCICTMEYRPVCGSDGKTYGNLCGLNCAVRNNPGLKLVHQGACAVENMHLQRGDKCICTDEYKPVCGNNLHTYPNMCEFECDAKKKAGLKLLYPMICIIM